MSEQETCASCKWARPLTYGKDGRATDPDYQCRRSPPTAIISPSSYARERAWPLVWKADWCGEHAPHHPHPKETSGE